MEAGVINIVKWQLYKKYHDKCLELCQKGANGDLGIDFERQHPKKYFFEKTRTFVLPDKDPETETWFFIDEYPNQLSYEKSIEDYTSEETAAAGKEFAKKLLSMCVPDSFDHIVDATEIPSLSIDFKGTQSH
ncbi:hypothetical protein [Ligilactobacillus acidipiscis]|uniref:hypothetical protein n=1 Tax=Ligilactobacillus acidipiscis TaxID=89059 RepID=UPI0023F7637E|nr:hypothetical protein [Ligilactobacillus acidipiscis]WEV57443.1 hypothetical protein OZX66_02545 [Ligilactobacillus acidipiscis]